ncbi:cysteine desulfurase [Clostridiales bacterium COT073_COT-073]|nr:cysteine desulfurase [Clostridiales bacterium COT073_COT-073]
MQRIYLDYAATTPLAQEVLAKMLPYFTEYYENPSALYSQKLKYELELARSQVAAAISAKPAEIIFTSGGTEANNLAVLGTARQFTGAHFITTQIEHDSVLRAFSQLEKEGHRVSYVPVDGDGRVDPADIEKMIEPETKLISVMAANNEIGTIQDIRTISAIAREKGILFHTDAVQAIGQVEINAGQADFISLSAHKLYGPKGVGALYVRKGVRLQPLLVGGHQESGRRAGTENMAGIIGFGAAIEQYIKTSQTRLAHFQNLGSQIKESLAEVEGLHFNGHATQRLAGLYHLSIADVSTEALLTMLDLAGISISAGSACQAGSYQISHVMKAIGDGKNNAHLRISLGKDTSQEEIKIFLEKLKSLIDKLRT